MIASYATSFVLQADVNVLWLAGENCSATNVDAFERYLLWPSNPGVFVRCPITSTTGLVSVYSDQHHLDELC